MAAEATKQERAALKKYLRRYYIAKENQADLQHRLRSLQADFRQGRAPTADAAEVEAQIQAEIDAGSRSLLEIVGIIALLPEDSTERRILALRHIDCLSWQDIQKRVYLTRSPCYRQYNKGLDGLLALQPVRAVLWPTLKQAEKDTE